MVRRPAYTMPSLYVDTLSSAKGRSSHGFQPLRLESYILILLYTGRQTAEIRVKSSRQHYEPKDVNGTRMKRRKGDQLLTYVIVCMLVISSKTCLIFIINPRSPPHYSGIRFVKVKAMGMRISSSSPKCPMSC